MQWVLLLVFLVGLLIGGVGVGFYSRLKITLHNQAESIREIKKRLDDEPKNLVLNQPVVTPNGPGVVVGRLVDGVKTDILVSHDPQKLPEAIRNSSLILDNRIIIRYPVTVFITSFMTHDERMNSFLLSGMV